MRIGDRSGRFLARCDFYWDEFGVVGEADGEEKYRTGDESPVSRQRRRALLTDTGLLVERWGWDEGRRFGSTAARLQRAFGDGAGPGSGRRDWVVLPDDRPRPDVTLLASQVGVTR